MAKTYIVCRPGMKQQLSAAFADMDVEVDDNLTTDYEFRQRDQTFEEILDEEVSKEERLEADPKQAITFVMCLGDAERPLYEPWLAVRVQSIPKGADVVEIAKKITRHRTPDGDLHISKIIGDLSNALRKKKFNVLSISEGACIILGG